jgi:hypothetical protein
LNPHAFRRHPLKMVCLPVPPLPHGCETAPEGRLDYSRPNPSGTALEGPRLGSVFRQFQNICMDEWMDAWPGCSATEPGGHARCIQRYNSCRSLGPAAFRCGRCDPSLPKGAASLRGPARFARSGADSRPRSADTPHRGRSSVEPAASFRRTARLRSTPTAPWLRPTRR